MRLFLLLCGVLLTGATPALAHAGGMAFWSVTVGETEVESRVLVPWPLDHVAGGAEADGAATVDREAAGEAAREAAARRVLGHFQVLEDGRPTQASVVSVRLLTAGMLEIVAAHALSATADERTLRSTFHLLTDDSHRVLARIVASGADSRGAPTVASPPFVLTAGASDHLLPAAMPRSWHGTVAPGDTLRGLVLLGVEHIVTGYDHLLFLLCLLLPGGTWRSRVAIVTAFTAAHSITLVLAALHLVTPPPQFVEVAIAISVAYVAIENLLMDGPRVRWPVAFGFGLIHGFGVAGMLDLLSLPAGALIRSALAFNVGVEIGQLGIVAVALPAIAWAARHAWHRQLVQTTSVSVCVLAAWWIMERLS